MPSRASSVTLTCKGCGSIFESRAIRLPDYCRRSCKSLPTDYNRERFGVCRFEGCEIPRYGSSVYCNGHYQQQSKADKLTPLGELKVSVEERFWPKVIKGKTECWLWNASLMPNGYGSFVGLGERYAHRVSYRLFKGEIPDGFQVDHKCHVRNCVNPDHLQAVTPSENGQNRSGPNTNTVSGIRGVSWDASREQWLVMLKVNGRSKNIGSFENIGDAEVAAIEARRRHYTNSLKDRT